jgi:hypothetical protein
LATLPIRISESQNASDAYLNIAIDDSKVVRQVILIDRGKNGTLDTMFVLIGDEWWELAPEKEAPYVSLKDIVTPSDDACFVQNLLGKLGITKK